MSGMLFDSVLVCVVCVFVGLSFGVNMLLCVGMEVLIGYIGGDLDWLVVMGVLVNGLNMLVIFSYIGVLLGNCYFFGMKMKEIKG